MSSKMNQKIIFNSLLFFHIKNKFFTRHNVLKDSKQKFIGRFASLTQEVGNFIKKKKKNLKIFFRILSFGNPGG